jgi:hypothetical protein
MLRSVALALYRSEATHVKVRWIFYCSKAGHVVIVWIVLGHPWMDKNGRRESEKKLLSLFLCSHRRHRSHRFLRIVVVAFFR